MKLVSFVDVCLQGGCSSTGVSASHALTCTSSVACKLRGRNSRMPAPTRRHSGEPAGFSVPDSQEPRAEPRPTGSPEQLFAALYRELHAMAERRLRGIPFGCTLSTTTLLHEAYLSLTNNQELRFPDRPHFLSYASRVQRCEPDQGSDPAGPGGAGTVLPQRRGSDAQPGRSVLQSPLPDGTHRSGTGGPGGVPRGVVTLEE